MGSAVMRCFEISRRSVHDWGAVVLQLTLPMPHTCGSKPPHSENCCLLALVAGEETAFAAFVEAEGFGGGVVGAAAAQRELALLAL